ncbi:MAG: tripartite tricarboxylate transporter permease [Planctomycetota bacterium]|jgi:putative tricarboxylic transport membrane protein|nr:tripartite tricarboxylate transporter permease [Planctomycetota bacterium]
MAFQYMLDACGNVLAPYNLLMLIMATAAGLVMGVLPGLSATMAIALLTGLTYNVGDHQTAIIALLGVYVGAISGGCQSAILLNIPGTPASAATAMDGFPLAKAGKGGLAIFIATTVSCLGTLLSVVFVLTLTPLLTRFALSFASWEFFLLSIFGILICGALTARGNALKGWISGAAGILVAQIGLDTVDTFERFSYGNVNVMSGIQLIPVMIGLFGFPEIVLAFKRESGGRVLELTRFNIREGFRIIRANLIGIARSALIGVGVGIIPGVGEDVGGWLSYWAMKASSREAASFGSGNPQGIVAAETGNNSCIGGAIIPVLSLAVPGSAPAAVLLAAFFMHNYRPGPLLMSESPEFVYNVAIYLVFASVAMWLLALGMARLTVRVLTVDKKILMPIIFLLCVIGAYLINYNLFDVKVMFVFGLVGLGMSYLKVPAAPFILGVVLGPMTDANLRRALRLSDGSFLPMFGRPICVAFLAVCLFMILSQIGLFSWWRRRRAGKGN